MAANNEWQIQKKRQKNGRKVWTLFAPRMDTGSHDYLYGGSKRNAELGKKYLKGDILVGS